jgi:hypothetical protein
VTMSMRSTDLGCPEHPIGVDYQHMVVSAGRGFSSRWVAAALVVERVRRGVLVAQGRAEQFMVGGAVQGADGGEWVNPQRVAIPVSLPSSPGPARRRSSLGFRLRRVVFAQNAASL